MFWAFISGLMVLAGAYLASDYSAGSSTKAEEGDEVLASFS